MHIRRVLAVLLFSVSLASAVTYSAMRSRVRAAGQSYLGAAPCVAFIPREWGEYRGASSYGVAFEDSYGTIRLIKNPPCDISATPHANLEIHRKR